MSSLQFEWLIKTSGILSFRCRICDSDSEPVPLIQFKSTKSVGCSKVISFARKFIFTDDINSCPPTYSICLYSIMNFWVNKSKLKQFPLDNLCTFQLSVPSNFFFFNFRPWNPVLFFLFSHRWLLNELKRKLCMYIWHEISVQNLLGELWINDLCPCIEVWYIAHFEW